MNIGKFKLKLGASAEFFKIFLQTSLKEISMDQLTTILRKNGIDVKISQFFPLAKRDEDDLKEYFTAAGLVGIYDFHKKQKAVATKEELSSSLTELVASSSPAEVH